MPEKILPKQKQRFDRKYEIVTETGCWIWTATVNPKGYGQFWIHPRVINAHRASYIMHIGDIPEGAFVLHRCDVRCCVNPNHLFLGTAQDNTDDMMKKGRGPVGENNGGAKLTESDVVDILSRSGERQQSLADEFGVCRQAVGDIISGRNWPHVTR